MTQIFVSYAHADHEALEKFLVALGPVAARLDLVLWHDDELQAGQKWDARIRAAIDASDIFICFVTNGFLKPGGYILKTELPAIRAAEKSRGALILPVIVEPSHWADEFSDTQAVPKTKRTPELRPISKWKSKQEGFHEASVQLKTPIIAFVNALPPRPDPGPGPTMAPTPNGFAIVGRRPTDVECADPSLADLHRDILKALAEIAPHLDRLGNVDPKLVRAVKSYAAEADRPFAEVALDRLWSKGALLCDRIETVSDAEMAEVLDPRHLRDLKGDLDRLHRSHSALIMSTTQGRDLVAKVTTHRSATQLVGARERAAHDVLSRMTEQKGLLEPATRRFVEEVSEPLGEGTERLDEIEAGIRTAVHAIAAFHGVFDDLLRRRPAGRPDEAEIRRRFADDANLAAILAAFDYLGRNGPPIAAFAADVPELRRYVERVSEVLAGIRRKPLRDPGEPPPGFDMDKVHEMILAGIAPPADWAPWVTKLSFIGKKELVDLSPLMGLTALRHLDLWSTGVTDLTPISGTTGLQRLETSRTAVTDLTAISGATGLQRLVIIGTGVTDLTPISGATGLQSLNICGTGITDLSPIERFTALDDLDASDLDDVTKWPENWPASLRQLNLRRSNWPGGRPLPEVPWRIDPDGTVPRGVGESPAPFRWWLADGFPIPPDPPTA